MKQRQKLKKENKLAIKNQENEVSKQVNPKWRRKKEKNKEK